MAPQADTTNAKQQIVARIQQATNILVAVGNSPSIDALSAALALSLTLNKLDKHATAVFSGQTPAVMEFLNPEKTFENTVDSLRDFIISLDKEKADRLRYKLENDVVRIYITPYRTTITQDDLQFSQGDFNVDLVIALGVEKREDLDAAIVAHGRILHDAAIVTVNANGQQSSLGAVDWSDPNASSLCEMLVALTEALQKPGLLDAQIANALLTGIVAATDRFSNQHTTPKVMTMSAQLMAAGANQQLVSINMQKSGAGTAAEGAAEPSADTGEAEVGTNGQLNIKHADEKDAKANDESKETDTNAVKAEAELDEAIAKPQAAKSDDKSLDDLKAELEQAAGAPTASQSDHKLMEGVAPPSNQTQKTDEPKEPKPESTENSWRGHRIEPLSSEEPISSGSEADLENKTQDETENRNSQVLSHDGQKAPDEPPTISPANGTEAGDVAVSDALKAVNSVLNSQEFNPAGNPRSDLGAQPMQPDGGVQPYIPINQSTPRQPPVSPNPAATAPKTDANGLPIIPPMPSLPIEDPTASNLPPLPPPLPPLPGEQQPPAVPPPPVADPNQPQSNDPGQFKIPGQ